MNSKTQFVSNLFNAYTKLKWKRDSNMSEVSTDMPGGYHIRIYHARDTKNGEYVIVVTTSTNLCGKTIQQGDINSEDITIKDLHSKIWDLITEESENKFWDELNKVLLNNFC